MKKIFPLFVAVLPLITFQYCKKGDPGPEGNANVLSKTFSPANITWNSVTEFGTNYKVADLDIPQITDDIITNGAVLVYAGLLFSEQTWTALPVSFSENGVTKLWTFGVKAGAVRLRYSQSNNITPSSPTIAFKVVYMTGKAVSLAKRKGINLSNYTGVQHLGGL